MADNVVNKVAMSAPEQESKPDNVAIPTNASNGEMDDLEEFKGPAFPEGDLLVSTLAENIENSLRSGSQAQNGTRADGSQNFGPLPARENQTSEIFSCLQDLLINDEGNDPIKRAAPKSLDKVGRNTVNAHSIAAYISTSFNPLQIRQLSTRIVSDTSLWLSRLFRFFDSSAYFHEDPREGLIRICRMMLHSKYPKFAGEGYEALYPRPPVLYISAACKSGLGPYLCSQLGLPISSLNVVPCNTVFGSNFKMDIAALEKLVQDDLASQKIPLVVVANAGTPIVGHVDNLYRLQEISKKNGMWLHVEGHSLAALCLASTPNLPAKIGDSMTIPVGTWLGVTSVPHVTLFRTVDPSLMHNAGLTFSLHHRLTCLPLWVCLQSLGSDGIVQRIKNAFELSKYLHNKLATIPEIKLLGKKSEDFEDVSGYDVSEILAKPISTSLLLDYLCPTVVFQYVKEEKPTQNNGGQDQVHLPKRNPPYFDNLNSWLGQILQRDSTAIQLDIVDLDALGVCVRFCPLESAHIAGTAREHIDRFLEIFAQQIAILNATVKHKETFRSMADENPNLQVVEIVDWAGLGGLRYIPTHLLQTTVDLPDSGKEDINRLNKELVQHLKAMDSAFSIGEGDDGLCCVRFGMVTEETDMQELISLLLSTGKEIEESSKYLETMAEVIKKGIETAYEDLKRENEEKLTQEGIIRQVPVVGTFVNWWYPLPKETGIKGRSFNLQSGVIESTENIYRYHMQIQEGSPKASPTTPRPSIQVPIRISPQHSRSSSRSSISSKGNPPTQQMNTSLSESQDNVSLPSPTTNNAE